MKTALFLAFFAQILVESALAATPEEFLQRFAAEAKREDAGFKSFSADAGRKLYTLEQTGKSGELVSCSTCHTSDPRRQGMTRANKVIEPLAPSANAARFTDPEKVEKWFRRNCNDVLKRECTAREKGDFIAYLRSVK